MGCHPKAIDFQSIIFQPTDVFSGIKKPCGDVYKPFWMFNPIFFKMFFVVKPPTVEYT